MGTASVVVTMDNELKVQAQSILDDLGVDLSTAVTDLLKYVVYRKALPFSQSPEELEQIHQKRKSFLGCMKGEIWISDDFNDPIKEMAEYM